MVEFIAIEQVQFKSTLNTCQLRSMARGGVQTLKNADGDKSHFSRGFTFHGRITPEEEASVEIDEEWHMLVLWSSPVSLGSFNPNKHVY